MGRKYKSKPKERVCSLFCSNQNSLKFFKVCHIIFYFTHHHSQSTPASTPSNPKHAHHNFARTCVLVCLFLFFDGGNLRRLLRSYQCKKTKKMSQQSSSTQLRETSFQLDVITTTKMLRLSDARDVTHAPRAPSAPTSQHHLAFTLFFLYFDFLRRRLSSTFFFEHVIGEKTQTKKKKIMCAMVVQTSWSTRALFCL